MLTNSNSVKSQLKYYGIRAKQVKRLTSEKKWGPKNKGYSEHYIRQVINGDRSCPKIEDLLTVLIQRAEYIYNV